MLQQAEWYTTYLDIRKEYPNPVTFNSNLRGLDDPYCVLIGASRYVYSKNGPSKKDKILHVLNPSLTDEQVNVFGDKIINSNDLGDFDKAWDLLAEAMSL